MHNWCKQNSKVTTQYSYIPWNVIFAFTVWAIWLGLNSLVFMGTSIPHQTISWVHWLRHQLLLAQTWQLDGVLPHSLLATNWLNTNVDFPVEFSNFVMDCRWLLRQDWEVRVEHVWQKANSCADGLAKRGASQLERQVFYDTCPIFFVEVSLLGFFGFCVLL